MKAGLYGWLNKNMTHMKGRKGQQGFTLIELLVVVTILGVLAAIVTLSLVGLTTNASVQSCNAEYKTVQAAIDAFMANNNLDTIAAQGTATNDMNVEKAATPPMSLYNGTPSSGAPNYTRNQFTAFAYTWDAHGKINGIFAKGGGAAPTGCNFIA
jgi:prepilin-type N-terminal cleavage/methylation domain-containing protein